MINTNKQLKAGALILLAGLYSAAASSATVDGQASAVILQPIVLDNVNDFDFGTIAAGSVDTTISVDAGGTVSGGGGTDEAVVTVTVGQALSFDITAAAISYTISIADGALESSPASAAPMTVGNFGFTDPGAGTGSAQTVTVTADLTVNADQPAGNYSTTNDTPIVISVDYD